jgi:hypothetical protein
MILLGIASLHSVVNGSLLFEKRSSEINAGAAGCLIAFALLNFVGLGFYAWAEIAGNVKRPDQRRVDEVPSYDGLPPLPPIVTPALPAMPAPYPYPPYVTQQSPSVIPQHPPPYIPDAPPPYIPDEPPPYIPDQPPPYVEGEPPAWGPPPEYPTDLDLEVSGSPPPGD